MYRDYYPEYEENHMEFKEEIRDLKDFYRSRAEESKEHLNEDWDALVDNLEDFIKDYRTHVKYCESYNNLLDKIEQKAEQEFKEKLSKFGGANE